MAFDIFILFLNILGLLWNVHLLRAAYKDQETPTAIYYMHSAAIILTGTGSIVMTIKILVFYT